MIKYSLVIPYFHRPDVFEKTLDTFVKFMATRKDYEILIMEAERNYTNEEYHTCLVDLVKAYKSKLNIKIERVFGFTGITPVVAYNYGAILAKGKLLLFTQPEILFENDVLKVLDKQFKKTLDSFVLISTKWQEHDGSWIWKNTATDPNGKNLPFTIAMSKEVYKYCCYDLIYAAGICFEDNDFINKIKKRDVPLVITNEATVLHQYHTSDYKKNKLHVPYEIMHGLNKTICTDSHGAATVSYKKKPICILKNGKTKSAPQITRARKNGGLRILFYKRTNLAACPDLWCRYFNKYTKHECRVVTQLPKDHNSFDFVHFNNTYERFPDFENRSIMHYHGHSKHEQIGGKIDLSYPGKIIVNANHSGQGDYPGKQFIRWFPVDLTEEIYSQKNPSDMIRIGYFPSKKDAKSAYHYKGYHEVMEVFDRLRSKYSNVSFDVCTGFSYNECLKRKAKCNIIVDECITGNYHMSGLEGLAMGKMVVGGVLPMNNRLITKMCPDAKELPFENVWNICSYQYMENFLEDIIKENKLTEVLDKGKSNRKWMRKNWNLKDMLKEMEMVYMSVLNG